MRKSLLCGLSVAGLFWGCSDLVEDNAAIDGGLASDAATDGDTAPRCGDNAIDPGEECDDGNLAAGDGCSSVCLDESAGCRPSTIGSQFLNNGGGKVHFENDLLYVSGDRNLENVGILIFDVSAPENISAVGDFQFKETEHPEWRILGLEKVGDHIWLTGRDPGLVALDVTNPSGVFDDFLRLNPSLDGPMARIGDSHMLFSESISERPGLYDVTNATPVYVASWGDSAQVYYNVGSSAELGFASTFQNIVDIFSADNLSSSTPVGRYTHAGDWSDAEVTKIVAEGSLLAFSVVHPKGTNDAIHLVDVSIPSAPNFIGSIQHRAVDMELYNGFLYIPGEDGIQVIDLREPGDPKPAGGVVDIGFGGVSLAIDDNQDYNGLAYVVGGTEFLAIEGLPGICDATCGNSVQEYPEECDDGNLDGGDGCNSSCLGE